MHIANHRQPKQVALSSFIRELLIFVSSLGNTVQGFKVTSAVDPTTGTVAPQVSAGWGSNLLITMNTEKPGTLEWKKKSGSFFGSVFGIEVSDETELRITVGDSKVTVTSKTDAGKTVTTEVGNGTVAVNVVDDAVISSNTAAVAAEAANVAATTTDGATSTDAAKEACGTSGTGVASK